MQDRFSAKVNDFVTWSETAIAHYRKGYHADALLNMRKSGEAACKLMFYYRFPEKLAIEKTEGKSYKELIQAVIWNNLAERKVINWLEAMQIHGNDAAHDKHVEKEDAEFAINALRLFIDWMFSQCIKSAVPSRLKNAVDSLSQTVKQESSHNVQKELKRVRHEKEELEKLLASFPGKKTEEAEKINKLSSELEKSIARLKELEKEKEKIKIIEEPVFIPKEIITQKKKTFSRTKLILAGAGVLSLITILFFVFKNPNNSSDDNKNKNEIVQQALAIDSFHVLILPLNIMQDNPNLTLKFEDAVQSRIQQRVKEKKIPISISFFREFNKPSLSADQAADEALKHNAQLVIYGEIYEPQSSSDSAQVNMKFSVSRKDNRVSQEMGIQSFLRLSDSASIKIQMGAACFVDVGYADYLMRKKKYNEALAVLYDAKPISSTQQTNVAEFLAECHFYKKNYPAAIKEIEKLIALNPKEDYGYAFMANVLRNAGDYKKAEGFYKKALAIKPNEVNTLLNYASLLAIKEVNRLPQAKQLLQTAIQYDTTNFHSWRYLADLEYQVSDYQNAVLHYRKSLSIDSTNTATKKSLAQILGLHLKQPEEAEKILSSILRKDSTDAAALFILGNIYTSSKLKNPYMAEYLLAKSKKYQTSPDTYSQQFAEGLAAFGKLEYKKAAQLLTEAYRIDSSDILLSNSIANCYLSIPDYDKAYYYIKHGWEKDTMDYISNANMGYFFMYAGKKYFDLKKATYYYEKALKTNPYDTMSLENLSTVYYNQGNLPGMKPLLLRLYNILPRNFTANNGLAGIYEAEGDYQKALGYYETAQSISPNDEGTYTKYTVCLTKISMKNYPLAQQRTKKAIERNPNNPDNYVILAQIYIDASAYQLAKENYDKALSLNPALKSTVIEQALDKLKGGL